MGKQNIVMLIAAVIVFASLIGFVADRSTNVNTLANFIDTTTVPTTVPANITLTNDYSAVNNLSNGSLTLSTGNYTLFSDNTSVVQIDDNSSWVGTLQINYAYQQSGYVQSSAARVLIGLIVLIFAIAVVFAIAKGKPVRIK